MMESQSKFVAGSVGPTRVRLQHGYIVENNVCRPGRVRYDRQKETPSPSGTRCRLHLEALRDCRRESK